ncbi:hypothetical protein BVG16_21735 [Paenibacillus selenitireducens]|uniref:N-acetyltransferase domain-containing protein n=1 Tax=Paenibacillus selenitireducens TaxID=1324314 RepID=A0A1T2X5R4_9BACL|nr:GNAT family N-acetyltransferase [Paenibacillus selenitireducens]OPA75224.1 hypothetical protein BVG16_21735 [Paenibacillus selenitireducens]
MNINVRWANETDAENLMLLNQEFNGVGLSISDVLTSIRQSKELIALAILDEEPVGFACAQWFNSFCYPHGQGEITEMYIQEKARRKGLATQLIDFLEQEFRCRGVKSVNILTGRDNVQAHKTYTRSNYMKKDEVVFQKKL